MENEHKWTVEIDDHTYQVNCVPQTSLYDVYVDGELAIRVPRKLRNDDSDSEYDLKIGTKRCQLVIYDGSPDLCVDGILLGAQREMDRKENRNRILLILGFMALIAGCTYCTFLWFVYQLAGQPFFGGYVALGLFIALIIFGVCMLLRTLKKKKSY